MLFDSLARKPAAPVDGFQHLPLHLIDPDPDNPRGDDDGEDMPELVASVASHGVLQPILVRPAGTRYRIVAGERRYRASTANGLPTIPAVVRDMTDQDAEEIQLIENAQRKDPNPLLLAGRLQRLIDRFRAEGESRPNEAAAAKLGKHPTWISNVLFCAECRQDVRDLISKGIVRDLGKIRELEKLTGKRREEAIAAAREAGKLTKDMIDPPKPKRERKLRPVAPKTVSEDPVQSTPAVASPPGAVHSLNVDLNRDQVIALIRVSGLSHTLAVGWDALPTAELLGPLLGVLAAFAKESAGRAGEARLGGAQG